MQKYIRTTLVAVFAILFAGYSWSQTPSEEIHNCTILSKPKSDQPESAFCNDCNFWPNGIVPYQFHVNVNPTQQQQMLDAMERLEGIANIDFIPRNGHSDFIDIINSNSNSSFIGMQGGGQDVNIASWNWQMIICHELLHALGFYHEQSRPDRNNYVQVNTDNICPGKENNFEIEDTGVTANIPYDFNSIMHYGEFAFSRCVNSGLDCNTGCGGGFFVGPTLEILPQHQNGQNQIGNREYITRTDSLLLRFTYPFLTDRFVNQQYTGATQANDGNTIRRPFNAFTIQPQIMDNIPAGSNVWIMPATHEDAEGTYTKAMTIRAPFGGVVLR